MSPFQSLRRPLGGFMVDAPSPQRDREREVQRAEAARAQKELGRLLTRTERMMRTLDDILNSVDAQSTAIDSLSALVSGLKKQIDDALGGQLTPSQQMRVDAIFNKVEANKQKIVDALNNNDDDLSNDTDGDKRAKTKTTVSSSNANINVGDALTLSAMVEVDQAGGSRDKMGGTVVFYVDDRAVGTAGLDDKGAAQLQLAQPLDEGDYQIGAKFSGDKRFAPSEAEAIPQHVGTTGTVSDAGGQSSDSQSQQDAAAAGQRDGAGDLNKPLDAPQGPTAEWPGDKDNYGMPTTQTRPTRAGLPDTPGVPNVGASGLGGQTVAPGSKTNAPGEDRVAPGVGASSALLGVNADAGGPANHGGTGTNAGPAQDANHPAGTTRDDGGQVGHETTTMRADQGVDFVDLHNPPSPTGVDLGIDKQKGKAGLDPEYRPQEGNPSIAGATQAAGGANATDRPVPAGGKGSAS